MVCLDFPCEVKFLLGDLFLMACGLAQAEDREKEGIVVLKSNIYLPLYKNKIKNEGSDHKL